MFKVVAFREWDLGVRGSWELCVGFFPLNLLVIKKKFKPGAKLLSKIKNMTQTYAQTSQFTKMTKMAVGHL